jgi:hypothetical protein
MRSHDEGIKVSQFAPCIQTRHVCKEVVDVITVWQILFRIPLLWTGESAVQSPLNFTFVVDRVESNDALQEDM